jgi:hypothetical protein
MTRKYDFWSDVYKREWLHKNGTTDSIEMMGDHPAFTTSIVVEGQIIGGIPLHYLKEVGEMPL